MLVQIAGALVIAAGVPRAFERQDFGVITLGYVLARLALIAQWLRAAHADPLRRATALRYAGGVAACQLGWLGLLVLPTGAQLYGWLHPAWAEPSGSMPEPWHWEYAG